MNMKYVRGYILIPALTVCLSGIAVAQGSDDDAMRDLTSSIVSNIGGGASTDAPQQSGDMAFEGEGAAELATLIQQAVREGKSNAYIDSLIKEAVDNGEVTVPTMMRTTSGDVDTNTVIASLVDKSLDAEQQNADNMLAALQAEASGEEQQRYHEVRRGESLAGIANRYYGSPREYRKIFDANRDQLNNVDVISPGQRLLIP